MFDAYADIHARFVNESLLMAFLWFLGGVMLFVLTSYVLYSKGKKNHRSLRFLDIMVRVFPRMFSLYLLLSTLTMAGIKIYYLSDPTHRLVQITFF